MGEERGFGPAQPVKPISGTLGLVSQSLELSTHPPDDIGIDPLQGRMQLRLIEVAVVGDPAANARVVHLKLEAEKVKVDDGKIALPVHILAVDNFRFLRM